LALDYIAVLEKKGDEWLGRILTLPGYKVSGTREEVERQVNQKLQQINRIHEDN